MTSMWIYKSDCQNDFMIVPHFQMEPILYQNGDYCAAFVKDLEDIIPTLKLLLDDSYIHGLLQDNGKKDTRLKFDYIIGNPPYDSGVVKKHHDICAEISTVRRGTEGFVVKGLKHLKDDGRLIFVQPFNFNSSASTRITRESISKYGSIVSVDTVANPKKWAVDGKQFLPSILTIMTLTTDKGADYFVNGNLVGNPVNDDLIYMLPKSKEEISILSKVRQKSILTLKDICSKQTTNLGSIYRDQMTDTHNISCIKGWKRSRGQKSVIWGFVSEKKNLAMRGDRLGFSMIQDCTKAEIEAIIVPDGVAYCSGVVLTPKPEFSASYVNAIVSSKLFKMLWMIFSGSQRIDPMFMDVPVWDGDADPYKFYELSDDEVSYVDSAKYVLK